MSSDNGKTPDYLGAMGKLFRRKHPGQKINTGSRRALYDFPNGRQGRAPMSIQKMQEEAGQDRSPWDSPEHYQDNRGLVPPEPMARALAMLSEIPVGHIAVVHNDRVPGFLLAQLDLDQMPYMMETDPDGSTIVRILKVRAYSFFL